MSIKQRLVQDIVFYRSYRHWKKLAKEVDGNEYHHPDAPSLVIVPCDPWSVGGSRGDEAMLTGVIQRYRHECPNIPIHIVCANDGLEYIRSLPISGISPIISWNGNYSVRRVYESILERHPTDVVILGADCMDGFYSPMLSLELLSIHDLCSKTAGIKSYLLGFSFNETPSWLMVHAFKSLSSCTKIRIRDSVSLVRFQKRIKHPVQLVADAAFMLQPQTDFPLYDDLRQWGQEQRAKGKKILGFNFHPMLRSYSGPEDIQGDARLVAISLEKILAKHPEVCFVFIPHDDRSRLTDNLMLSTMYEYFRGLERESNRVYYSPEVPRAPQLKALCGLLDGLLSSRMHLAIAALGMGTPVMAATYQGKFEGLFQHFGLDESYLLPPKRFLSDDLVSTFDSFIHQLPELKKQITERLPLVEQYSYANLSGE